MTVGELVRSTDGAWMTRPPDRCPHGHPLGPGRVLVGHQPCGCEMRGGHTTWTCQCGATVYGPPMAPGCQPLAGAGRMP
jgi:hypothetical protein